MIKVGTFAKSVGAAPVSQAVINVGFPPKALILWSAAQTTLASWTPHIIFAVGMTDGTRSYTSCEAMEDGIAGADVSQYFDNLALAFYDYNGVLQAAAEAVLDPDGFTLTWTTNNASAYYIHYLALGGDDLTDAYVLNWTLTNLAPNQAVAGVPFQPDLAIHLCNYPGTIDDTTAYLGFGAMDASGNQFATGNGAIEWLVATGNAANLATSCLTVTDGAAISHTLLDIAYVSMDAGGFTVSKTTPPTLDTSVATLCLKGGSYRVGNFNEAIAPGLQAIVGIGFPPEGVLIFSGCGPNNMALSSDARIHIGAMDSADECVSSFFYHNAANPSEADATSRTNACILAGGGDPTSDRNVAAFSSLDANGFSLLWSVTTDIGNSYGYIAFDTGGIAPPPAAIRRFGGAMTTPFTSKKWALWVQPAGPNTPNYYLGCHTLDDVEEPGGGIKDLIRCFKADGSGWEIRGSTRNPPEPITTTVTGLIENTANWLERIVEGANCPFPLYVNGKLCPPYAVFGGADRWYTLESAEIGTASLMGLAHREEDNISEQSFEITAWPPLIRGRGITSDRITVTATENWNDIASCSTPRCGGNCGSAVDACDTLVAVADADPASADVWFSFDNGATWTAGTTDPYAGPVTDLKSVVCFPIDSDTTRVLVVREAFAGSPAAVYYSDDWGANWTEVLLTTPNNYGAVYGGALFALDMYHIWVVVTDGAASEVHFSDDGGETWTEQTVPAGVFYALWFSDANTGMMVGTTDDVITTTDGGTTWTAATATGGGDTNLTVTESAGGDYWWIGTNAGEIWYSSNHGVTWTQRAFPGDGAGSVYGIDFISPTVGFMAHSPTNATAILYRTRDGGLTWEAESGTIPGEIYSVKACSVNQAFAVGEIATTALVYKMHD